MRQFTTLFTISLILFSGCSSTSERYTPSTSEEKVMTSYKNVRLLRDNRSQTVLSAVFLNQVYPKYADGSAHFVIGFYTRDKNSALCFDKKDVCAAGDYTLVLNGENALYFEELEMNDPLRELMPVNIGWNRYYYVRYKLPSASPVLVLESDHTERAAITYQKEPQ
ncbi:hypothetical protein [Sulfurimonas sp. HSL3-7]|uniref:hypothetical protein n=1 Tax=Sulfonitrofixus jiaomeiensis TaxID=3131938 RepID=UPI0031F7E638